MNDLPGERGTATVQGISLLRDQYFDFCKKLRFLIKGAFTNKAELLALEIISDYLGEKIGYLEELYAGTVEKSGMPSSESFEASVGRMLMENQDYRLLQRIAEVRSKGGPDWRALQSILKINGSYSVTD